MHSDDKNNFFTRHPKKSFIIFLIVVFMTIDFLGGAIFIPPDKNFRTSNHIYHHGLIPNKETESVWRGDDSYPVYTNSLGFFDSKVRDVPLVDKSKRRILIIGDSYTEGIGVQYEKTFVGLLNKAVDSDKVEIFNAALSSYSPKLYYLKVKHLIEEVGFKFDELYVFIDISDIQDEILYLHYEPKESDPKLRASARADTIFSRLSLSYYLVRQIMKRKERERNLMKYPSKYYPPWLNYYWLNDINVEVATIPNFIQLRDRWTFSDFYENKWMKQGVNLAVGYMTKLNELASEHDIMMTVGVYPWPIHIDASSKDNLQVWIWKKFSTRYGTGFIDLFPLFIGEGAGYEGVYDRYFIKGDIHWNEAGHRLVAERVMKDIRK